MFSEAEGYRNRFNRPLGPVRPPLGGGNPTSATVSSKTIEDEVEDPNPLIKKLQDPKSISDRKVRR
jgi:hypothetical protein